MRKSLFLVVAVLMLAAAFLPACGATPEPVIVKETQLVPGAQTQLVTVKETQIVK